MEVKNLYDEQKVRSYFNHRLEVLEKRKADALENQYWFILANTDAEIRSLTQIMSELHCGQGYLVQVPVKYLGRVK